jgi:hypothetical protein
MVEGLFSRDALSRVVDEDLLEQVQKVLQKRVASRNDILISG